MIPGFPIPVIPVVAAPSGAVFEMVADDFMDFGALIGWISATAAADQGFPQTGSASGGFGVDGGTVEGVFFSSDISGHAVFIKNGNQGATSINIGGSDYPLIFDRTSDGYDNYTFGSSTPLFADAVTYNIEVT